MIGTTAHPINSMPALSFMSALVGLLARILWLMSGGFTKLLLTAAVLFLTLAFSPAAPRPNIILAMADDMGWGDPGYNSVTVTYADGTPHPDQGWISTPTMDAMAGNGLRFDRFYSASAVCSPTRASCLTGRNPVRVGVPYANSGRLGFDETSLPEILSDAGYLTGHFGKWHLGSMTTLRSDSNRGGNASVYSAPWHHSYDFCFATESKVPTYHPYRKASNAAALPTSFSDSNFYGTYYWRMPATWNQTSGEGEIVPVNEVNNATNGDDSKLIVDQAIPFIQDAVSQGKPFFVVIWFHTPHKPMVDPDGASNVDSSDALKDSIEDMDIALGRLRDELTTLGVRDNTMFWLTSDNGPEDGANSPNETSTVRSLSSGRFLERKRSLHEGGVRVPGILEWPDVISTGTSTDFPAITSDYYTTILDYLELSVPNQKPLDGISLRPVIEGTATTRTSPIGFQLQSDKSWVSHQYKLIDDGSGWELYDLINVASGEEVEQTPIATASNVNSKSQAVQDVYQTMLAEYTAWNDAVIADTPYVHHSRPTVTLGTPQSDVDGSFNVTATFNENVTQLNANEFTVTNGTVTGLVGSGTSWTVTISPSSPGAVSVSLPEGVAIDSSGNPNAKSNDLDVTYTDPTAPPTATLTGPSSATAAYTVTINFSEDVTGLTDSDFNVVNGTASGVAGSGSAYTVTITPSVSGDVTLTLPTDSVFAADDGAGNTASNDLVTAYATPPGNALISNGRLDQIVGQYSGIAGNSEYTLDTTTLNILENGSDTGVDANAWLWSALTRGFSYDASGGGTGQGGAFVGSSDFNQKPRAVAQFATDGKTTQSWQSIKMDVLMDDNTASNALTLLVELYAWNTGELGPQISLGGGTVNDPSYNVTNLNDAATLLNTTIAATAVGDATWETFDLGNVDLGSGYDYYAWRIGIMGAEIGDNFAFDNLTVSPYNFSDWISVYNLDPVDQDFDRDPDGDNLSNGLEAWFGTHPGQFSNGLADVITDGTTTTFSHPQNEDPPVGVTGTYQWSTDLIDWYVGDGLDGPVSGLTVNITPNVSGSTANVTATASEEADMIFFRVEAASE